MANMEMAKMDMNDPVMKAMHMKCMPAKKPADSNAAAMDHSKMQDMDHSKMPGMSRDMAMPEHGGH